MPINFDSPYHRLHGTERWKYPRNLSKGVPILGKTVSKNLLRRLYGAKKRSLFKIHRQTPRLNLWRLRTSKNVGSIKMIYGSGPANRDSTKCGVTLKLTSWEYLKRHKNPPGIWGPKDMRPMCNPHKPMRHFSQNLNSNTQWLWQILQRQQKLTGHWFHLWPIWSQISQHRSKPSPQSFQLFNKRTLVSKDPDIVCPTQVPQPIIILPLTKIFILRLGKINPKGYFSSHDFKVG